MIVARFAASFRKCFPDLLGRRLAVALSGGADSVALLRLLTAAEAELAIEVVAVHVHHHIRGPEADGDLEFCRKLGSTLGVPLFVQHLDPQPPKGRSPEQWWREERYRLLQEVCRDECCAAVATAHTRDDQAETVLLKLLRGAGPRGVAGVRRRAGGVIRPVLDFRRAELRAWLVALGQEWREDSTNETSERPRSVIRRDVLPLLAAFSPAAIEHLAFLAASLAEDDDLLGELLAARSRWPEVGAPVPLDDVRQLPRALRRRWLLEMGARLPLAEPPSRRQLEQFLELVDGSPTAAIDLGRRWVLRRRDDRLLLAPPPCGPFAAVAAEVPSEIKLPGGFTARIGSPSPRSGCHRAMLASRCRELRLSWRSARPGERLGGQRGPTVRAALAKAGVPAEWRRGWPVLEAGDTMIWAPGAGVADGWEDETGEVFAELEEPWRRQGK